MFILNVISSLGDKSATEAKLMMRCKNSEKLLLESDRMIIFMYCCLSFQTLNLTLLHRKSLLPHVHTQINTLEQNTGKTKKLAGVP